MERFSTWTASLPEWVGTVFVWGCGSLFVVSITYIVWDIGYQHGLQAVGCG